MSCEETSEEQVKPGERRIVIPDGECSGWFVFNPDPSEPTFKHYWRWDAEVEVLVEVEDRGGYGTFKEGPKSNLSLVGSLMKRVRFKSLGKLSSVVLRAGDMWCVAIVRNDTSGPISYQIQLNANSWQTFPLLSGEQRVHSQQNRACNSIKYDYKYDAGSQERERDLKGIWVLGHEPTEAERARAKVHYFKIDENGEIELYAEP